MKTIAIGDIHGYKTWRKIIDQNEDADSIIFIGDYCDCYGHFTVRSQIDNFLDILEYKRANLKKVKVLFGNHDEHYRRGSTQKCSGFQPLIKLDIEQHLHDAIKNGLIQMCHQQGDILFTHAGVSKTWLREVGFYDSKNNQTVPSLETAINELFICQPRHFEFCMGETGSRKGDDVNQSPIWIRPFSLRKDRIDNFRQVVGHTQVDSISTFEDVTLIDALKHQQYLLIENGKMIVKKILF